MLLRRLTMANKFRGTTWNNARFGPKIQIRRSIDLAELGDFGEITETPSDLPTAGATHRSGTKGSRSATRGYTDLQGLFDTVVDNQDMGLVVDAATAHRIWSSTGAITDIVTEAPTGILAPSNTGDTGSGDTGSGDTGTGDTGSGDTGTGGFGAGDSNGDGLSDWSASTLAYTLDNPNPYGTSTNDKFGWSVAVDGDYAIVSAYQEDDAGGTNSGKAYIFAVDGTLVHTLDNPNDFSSSSEDQFGNSIAISGNYAIVGASREDDVSGSTSGKAYIFDVTTGALVHTLDNPNPYGTSASDYFGISVAISGDYAIVGAYAEDDAGGSTSGKAYIFDVTTGALLYTLDNPTAYGTSAGDRFGGAVAMSGNYAIVGAEMEDDAVAFENDDGDEEFIVGLGSGKAYIFDVTTGALVHTLDNPNAHSNSDDDYFGNSVAISGDYAIVGAYAESDNGGDYSGKAYIYDVSTGALVHTLDNPNPAGSSLGDEFGRSVAISGDYAIVSATGEDESPKTPTNYNSGKVYIYNVTSGALVETLDNPNAYDTEVNDRFGRSVAISDGRVIVGAWEEDDAGGTSSGKAYIFTAG